MSSDISLSWSDTVVVFNSLITSIETLRKIVDSDELDDDDLYDAEESLNDYVTLLARLRSQYKDLEDKGELTPELEKKLREIC